MSNRIIDAIKSADMIVRELLAIRAGEEVVLSETGDKSVEQVADAEQVKANFDEHKWNTMEIIAKGPRLIQKINGVHFATLIDHDSEHSREKGFIAFQDSQTEEGLLLNTNSGIFFEFIHTWASAKKIFVTIYIIYSRNWWPKLISF